MRHNVKLPKLVIDKYAGDISQWQYFWGQFETAVHPNPNLTTTDKFSYLRSYLTGAAANVIAGLPFTEASYDNEFNCCITGLAEKIWLLMLIDQTSES